MKNNPRLERAKHLSVIRIGPRQYKVGNQYVDLNEMDPCHCEDYLLRTPQPEACKHMLAAMLYEQGEK